MKRYKPVTMPDTEQLNSMNMHCLKETPWNSMGPNQLANSIRTVPRNTILIVEDIPADQYEYRPTRDKTDWAFWMDVQRCNKWIVCIAIATPASSSITPVPRSHQSRSPGTNTTSSGCSDPFKSRLRCSCWSQEEFLA